MGPAAGIAIAAFGLVNVVLGLFGFADRNDLWVRGAGAPGWVVAAAVAGYGAARLGGDRLRVRALRPAALLLAGLCAADAVQYVVLRARGDVAGGFPLPLSLLPALVLAADALRPAGRGSGSALGRAVAVPLFGVAFVALHLLAFGETDYRRPADAAVVLGAAVRADGSPSGSLRDRTLTACRLWREGLVRRLVLSGGRDPAAPRSEPEAMAELARAEGVPADAIVLDETGVTSAATIATAARLARENGWRGVLLVSHDYHLARLHLLARSAGLSARTVPAVETVAWPTKPLFVLREVAAWSWSFVRTLG